MTREEVDRQGDRTRVAPGALDVVTRKDIRRSTTSEVLYHMYGTMRIHAVEGESGNQYPSRAPPTLWTGSTVLRDSGNTTTHLKEAP